MERKLRAGASRQPLEREQGECSGVASSSLVEGAAAVVFRRVDARRAVPRVLDLSRPLPPYLLLVLLLLLLFVLYDQACQASSNVVKHRV